MNTLTAPDHAALQAFFQSCFGAVEDGWLVLSTPHTSHLTKQGKRALVSTWLDLACTPMPTLVQAAARIAAQGTLYYGVVVQRPDCAPAEFKRTRAATAYQVPGLWFDLDLAYGAHAASTLPQTDDAALDFLASLPAPPSLIVHSGGGLYGHWLFHEPFVITSDADRETIAQLSRAFTHTLVQAGTHRGWTLDALGDLARVLRPPGSINTKYDRMVTLLHEGAERYNPADFDWLLPLPERSHTTHSGQVIPGQPDLVAIAEHYGTVLEPKSQTELAGAHPQHGSSTGDNFNVNTAKGLWHCFRHGTGGDALSLIAVCAELLPCEQATAGAVRGDLFRQVVAIANETFQSGIALGYAPREEEWAALLTHPGADRRATPRATDAWNPLNHPPDFIDPWLGPRSQWCGIPLDVRRV